jgi:DNA-binding MarR family transcriptional regulator
MARNIVLTQQALATLNHKPLSTAEHRVLWHLAATLPITGDSVSKADLEDALSITQVHLNVVVKRLCEEGFLMRGAKMGRSYHYKLNPAFIRIIA